MAITNRTLSGRIAFLPWVKLPYSVTIEAFRFVPVETQRLDDIFGSALSDVASKAIRTHVGQDGRAVKGCTVILRPRAATPWEIPENSWRNAARATDLLTLSCLSDQQFFKGHFTAHLNAAMFRPVSMHIDMNSDRASLFYRRRGGGLLAGGRSISETVFQQPPQVEGTGCDVASDLLARAISKARRAGHEIWDRVSASMDFFLLANAETPDLTDEDCLVLSAIAFERLLRPSKPSALEMAKAFFTCWQSFKSIPLNAAKRVKADHKPDWHAEQATWPVRRKWMKELYVARSARVHEGPKSDFSVNWKPWQHMVVAAFAYPLTVKILLRDAGFYSFTPRDEASCDVFDKLLDSSWGRGDLKAPEWPRILDEAVALKEWDDGKPKLIAAVQRSLSGRRRRHQAP